MRAAAALGWIVGGMLMVNTSQASPPEVETDRYGALPDGREVRVFTLRNASGTTARILEYGAILASLEVADRDGRVADVTLGFDALDGWLDNAPYFGATVGRFANRIAAGRFTLDGKSYQLATNNDPGGTACHLHGGARGFDKVLWRGEAFEGDGERGVRLAYVSPDGEEGYPGELRVAVTYVLTDRNELIWRAEATADAPTIVNLAHHTYWNLSGDAARGIDDHELTLHADHFLPTNAGLIPTGVVATVSGTPMDFRNAERVGARVDDDFSVLRLASGYDHCWVLRGPAGATLRPAAVLRDPASGRVLRLSTDQPGLQFYSGNFLDGTIVGKGGVRYQRRAGLCLETENFPDAPNQRGFPPAVLRPGETYVHTMVHAFSVDSP